MRTTCLLAPALALFLSVCGGSVPAGDPPPLVAVPIAPAASAGALAEVAPEPPDETGALRRLLVLKRYLRMVDCGHDTAAGELRCAFATTGEPRPTPDRQTLHTFITDPPGLVLAATDWQPAHRLGDEEAVVAECEFAERAVLGNVHLAAVKGVPGWRHGGQIVAGVAEACTFAPYRELPERLGVAHLVVMHDDSKRKPPGVSRTRLEAAGIADRAADELDRGKLTLAEAVEKYSDERGSASRGGSLGVVRLGMMVPEFELLLLATPIGERSPSFESAFGFHVIERRAADR
ncbi:MAG: peptidyl-prolyl cis-trans isomerase [Deltaproteobacteria bacterium]|nr:peptidyl-prolyl cis-trans isomerase [Deltaproteobacteria bacterium]